MSTILIADDDIHIRNVVAAFLSKQGFETLLFETGDRLIEEFIKLSQSGKNSDVKCIILDIMMPGRSGYEICQLIREFSAIPIILISAKNSDFDKIKGLRLGSDDYLVKPFSPLELVARVESLIRRYHYHENKEPLMSIQTYEQYGNIIVDDRKKEVFCASKKLELTQTEFALLSYLIQQRLKTVSREELLKNIWEIEVPINTRVIDDTLKRLRKKLKEAASNVKIETVWGYGFMLEIVNE